jgi:hypothetical protein
MRSLLTDDFIDCFSKLPANVKELARKNYKLWKRNPSHPGLNFKPIGKRLPAFSIRIGIGWRALAVKDNDDILWFWIGSHTEYDKLIKRI